MQLKHDLLAVYHSVASPVLEHTTSVLNVCTQKHYTMIKLMQRGFRGDVIWAMEGKPHGKQMHVLLLLNSATSNAAAQRNNCS